MANLNNNFSGQFNILKSIIKQNYCEGKLTQLRNVQLEVFELINAVQIERTQSKNQNDVRSLEQQENMDPSVSTLFQEKERKAEESNQYHNQLAYLQEKGCMKFLQRSHLEVSDLRYKLRDTTRYLQDEYQYFQQVNGESSTKNQGKELLQVFKNQERILKETFEENSEMADFNLALTKAYTKTSLKKVDEEMGRIKKQQSQQQK